MSDFSATAHAVATAEAKGFDLEAVEAVWRSPDITYPSNRYKGQHKRLGAGLCLCCDDKTGRVITIFVDQVETDLRPDQTQDNDAQAWHRRRK